MTTSKTHQTGVGWQIFVILLLLILLVGNSLKKYKFQVFIRSRLHEREQSLLKSHKLTMEVDQEFADIFERSQMVSGKVMKAEYFFSTKRKIPSFIKESTFEKEAGCSNED